MKVKGYVLFVILNDVTRLKDVLQAAKKIGLPGGTVIDTIGSASLYSSEDRHVSLIASTMKSLDEGNQYNKMIFFALHDENQVKEAMGAIQEAMDLKVAQPGKGIMFTIPIMGAMGLT
jgi:nitrogen regulatory protein PII